VSVVARQGISAGGRCSTLGLVFNWRVITRYGRNTHNAHLLANRNITHHRYDTGDY